MRRTGRHELCSPAKQDGASSLIYHLLIAVAFGTGIGNGLCRAGVGVYHFTRKTPPTALAMAGMWAAGPVAYLLQDAGLAPDGFIHWLLGSAAMGLPCLLILIALRRAEVAEGRAEWVRTGGRMGSSFMVVGETCDERYSHNSGRLDEMERRLAAYERALDAAFDHAGIRSPLARQHLQLLVAAPDDDSGPMPKVPA